MHCTYCCVQRMSWGGLLWPLCMVVSLAKADAVRFLVAKPQIITLIGLLVYMCVFTLFCFTYLPTIAVFALHFLNLKTFLNIPLNLTASVGCLYAYRLKFFSEVK